MLLLLPGEPGASVIGPVISDGAPAAAVGRERPLAGAGGRRRQPARARRHTSHSSTGPAAFAARRLRGRAAARQPGLARVDRTARLRRLLHGRSASCGCRDRPTRGRASTRCASASRRAYLSVSSAHRRGGSRRSARRLQGGDRRSTRTSPRSRRRSTRTCCRGWRARTLAADERKKAAEAYLRVYYEFPLTDAAIAADTPARIAARSATRDGRLQGRPRPRPDLLRRAPLSGSPRRVCRAPGPGCRATIASSSISASPSAISSSSAMPRPRDARAAVSGERLAQGGSALLRA